MRKMLAIIAAALSILSVSIAHAATITSLQWGVNRNTSPWTACAYDANNICQGVFTLPATGGGALVPPSTGGTGVNNGTSTFTIGGNVAFSGAHTFVGTLTGNTAVTFPTSGTLATTTTPLAPITPGVLGYAGSGTGTPTSLMTLPSGLTIPSALGITIAPTASTLNQALVTSQTPAGTISTSFGYYNQILIGSDNVNAGSNQVFAFGVQQFCCGTSAQGTRFALGGAIDIETPSNSADPTPFYIGTVGIARAHTAAPNNAASVDGINGNAQLDGSSTGWAQVGNEFDTTALAGSSVLEKFNIALVQGPNDAVHGSNADAAIFMISPSSATAGWTDGWLITNSHGGFPISTTGDIIRVVGNATMANGIDLSLGATYTGCTYKGIGFCIDGLGGAFLGAHNSASFPASASFGLYVGSNFLGGGGSSEVDFFNVVNAATNSFAWIQKTGASAGSTLAVLNSSTLSLIGSLTMTIPSMNVAGVVTNNSSGVLATTPTLSGALGGTGVDNSGKTITLGGNLTTSGAFGTTLTVTAATNSTLPAGTHSLAPLDSPSFTGTVSDVGGFTSTGSSSGYNFGDRAATGNGWLWYATGGNGFVFDQTNAINALEITPGSTGSFNSLRTTASTSVSTGSIVDPGGLGVAGAEWLGGLFNVAGAVTLQTLSTQGQVCNSAAGLLSTTTSTNCPGVTAASFTVGTTVIGGAGVGVGDLLSVQSGNVLSNITAAATGRVLISQGAGVAPAFSTSLTLSGAVSFGGTVNLPGLSTSSAGTTGTLCWTTGTGNVNVDTTTTCLLSLEELKDKHGPITGALNEISKLEPFWYTWKHETPEWAGDKMEQPGLGAHQVESVDPRLAGYGMDGSLHGVRYAQMSALLVAGFHEQMAVNDNIESRLEALERKVK